MYCGHWSTPLVLGRLAGVVHDRESADGKPKSRCQCHACGEREGEGQY
jgi:hypothetical protein